MPPTFPLPYLLAANLISFGLFWLDKYQAQRRGQRVPERLLQALAVVGGWPAGWSAMRRYRHKTQKPLFQAVYLACTAVNILLMASTWRRYR